MSIKTTKTGRFSESGNLKNLEKYVKCYIFFKDNARDKIFPSYFLLNPTHKGKKNLYLFTSVFIYKPVNFKYQAEQKFCSFETFR